MSKLTQVEMVAARLLDLGKLFYGLESGSCQSRTVSEISTGAKYWRCTRKYGHEGFHVAHYGDGKPCEISPWYDEDKP